MGHSRIQLGDISLASVNVAWPSKFYELFAKAGPVPVQEEWKLESATKGAKAPLEGLPLLFDSGGSWRCYEGSGNTFFLESVSDSPNGKQSPVLWVNSEERLAIFFGGRRRSLSFPLDELFFLHAFGRCASLLVHSCLVEWQGKGFLFCGISGAGKSTLAKILQKSGLSILCDERNVVTSVESGEIFVSSTPWHGTAKVCSWGSLPLKALVFLDPKHSGFELLPAALPQAIAELSRVIFLPQFSPSGVAGSVKVMQQLLERVPSFTLTYNKSSVDIAGHLKGALFPRVRENDIRAGLGRLSAPPIDP